MTYLPTTLLGERLVLGAVEEEVVVVAGTLLLVELLELVVEVSVVETIVVVDILGDLDSREVVVVVEGGRLAAEELTTLVEFVVGDVASTEVVVVGKLTVEVEVVLEVGEVLVVEEIDVVELEVGEPTMVERRPSVLARTRPSRVFLGDTQKLTLKNTTNL